MTDKTIRWLDAYAHAQTMSTALKGVRFMLKKDIRAEIKQLIFNNPVTIVLWNDGTKTVVKASSNDTFNKEKGFLHAYFEKHSGMSKSQISKYFKEITE